MKANLRECLHEIICLLLRMTMIPWFLREVYARHKVTIINYHNPESETFERHVRFYVRNYSVITMDQLATSLSSGNWSLLPEKPLIMTFDDGHVGNKFLFEVLKKYNVPSIIYVVAGVINTKRRFWFSLASVQSQTIAKLRLVDDAVRRAILRCDYCHTDEREYQERDALNTEELNRFITTGGTVGCHTMFHPFLTKCSKETAMLELKESKKILEQLCNCSIKHFAYPDGAWDNTARGWVQDVGFITARTTDSDWVTPNSDLLALPNFGINDDAGLSKMIVQTSGLWVLLKCFATYFRGT